MLAFQDYSPAKILQQTDTSLNRTTFNRFSVILSDSDILPNNKLKLSRCQDRLRFLFLNRGPEQKQIPHIEKQTNSYETL